MDSKSSSPNSKAAGRVTLPVSLEDLELFPRNLQAAKDAAKLSFDQIAFEQMLAQLGRIWWSRLIIATRGYVCNLAPQTDEILFALDDAFIQIHRSLVESKPAIAVQLMLDLAVLDQTGTVGLNQLAQGHGVSQQLHPWLNETSGTAYRRLFGASNPRAYAQALKQRAGYLVFFEICCRLQARWREQQQKKKGVSFQEDPEWQPDDRVVLFQQFFKGNRTWVLFDFDRHVLACWRPFGVNVIFGERYLQSKLDDGYRLCQYCGMLEANLGEFPICPKCPQEGEETEVLKATAYCSSDCLHADIERHEAKCHSND